MSASPLGRCHPAQELLPPRAADDEAQVHALCGKALLQALAREAAQDRHLSALQSPESLGPVEQSRQLSLGVRESLTNRTGSVKRKGEEGMI